MGAKDAKATAALTSMAKASGTDLKGFNGQLATTYLYCDAGRAPSGDHQPRPGHQDGPGAQVLLQPWAAGRGRQVASMTWASSFPAARRWATREHQDALRYQLHEAGGGRQAVSRSAMRRLINQHPGAARHSRSACCRSSPCCSSMCSFRSCGWRPTPTTSCCRRSPRIGSDHSQLCLRGRPAQRRILLWADTWASLQAHRHRRWGSVRCSGWWWPSPSAWCRALRALLSPLLSTVSMMPPLALLPMLFIVLGLDETSKIALIVIGIAPVIARDLALKSWSCLPNS